MMHIVESQNGECVEIASYAKWSGVAVDWFADRNATIVYNSNSKSSSSNEINISIENM